MTTKGEAQFSLEECPCMEMTSQMMSPSEGQPGIDEACAAVMSQFTERQGDGACFEMMSQMMASCCNLQQEDDKVVDW